MSVQFARRVAWFGKQERDVGPGHAACNSEPPHEIFCLVKVVDISSRQVEEDNKTIRVGAVRERPRQIHVVALLDVPVKDSDEVKFEQSGHEATCYLASQPHWHCATVPMIVLDMHAGNVDVEEPNGARSCRVRWLGGVYRMPGSR
jgi:hypothetical protein